MPRRPLWVIGATIFLGLSCLAAVLFFTQYKNPSVAELVSVDEYYSCSYYRDLNTDSVLCPSKIREDEGKSVRLSEKEQQSIFSRVSSQASLRKIDVIYPIKGSFFPPDIVAPTVVWSDSDSKSWMVHIRLKETNKTFAFKTNGRFHKNDFDYRVPVVHETLFEPSKFRSWKIEENNWETIKKGSKKDDVVITVYGVRDEYDEAKISNATLLTQGEVSFKTAPVPVDAPIFYRDVMLAVTKDNGKDVLFTRGKFSGIKWRLRNISKEDSKIVMQNQKGCANCHAASRDGKWLGFELDTVAFLEKGDKSGYGIMPLTKNIVYGEKDVINFRRYTPDIATGGYYPRPSPDGRYVLVTGEDSGEHLYFNLHPEKPCMFTFYLIGGKLMVWDRITKEYKPLKGADDPKAVQHDSDWSPDGKTIVFGRGPHKDARIARFTPRDIPDFAQNRDQWVKESVDKDDFLMQYDLYTVPFNGGEGGEAKPLPGASKNGKSNSNPRYSPDGKWIVYTQTHTGMLLQPDSELYMISAQGGEARRLNANTRFFNSWHSWSPNGRWLVFASKAYSLYTQMMLTYIDENGIDYPPVIVPNSTSSNRAINLPEFFNVKQDAIESIETFEYAFMKDYEKAMTFIDAKKWDKAEKALQESKEKSWQFAETFLALGYVALKQGQKDKARGYFEDALIRDDHLFQTYYNLGILNLEEKRFDDAIRNFEALLKQNPDESNGWHNLGVAYAAKGEHSKAKEAFEKALAKSPDRSVTYYNLGLLLKRENEHEKAKDVLTKALTIAKSQNASDLSSLIRKAM